jgi:hypothetical protein
VCCHRIPFTCLDRNREKARERKGEKEREREKEKERGEKIRGGRERETLHAM